MGYVTCDCLFSKAGVGTIFSRIDAHDRIHQLNWLNERVTESLNYFRTQSKFFLYNTYLYPYLVAFLIFVIPVPLSIADHSFIGYLMIFCL